MNRRSLAFSLALGIAGCCAPISPTTGQVKSWVATDLPVGSSEARVERFCNAHGFDYSSGHDWGNATRRVGGCGSVRPVVWMQMQYDGARRLTGIQVYGGSLEP